MEYGQAYKGVGISQGEARHRMVMLAMARAKYNQRMKEEAEKAQRLAKAEEHAANEQGVSSVWGSIGQGALAGAGIGAVAGGGGGAVPGAIIGGLAGLALGSAAEAKNRRTMAKVEGRKDPGWGGALKNTLIRTPTINEFGRLVGAAGGVGSMMAGETRSAEGKALAAQEQGIQDWRMQEALADKTGRYGSASGAPFTVSSAPSLAETYKFRNMNQMDYWNDKP